MKMRRHEAVFHACSLEVDRKREERQDDEELDGESSTKQIMTDILYMLRISGIGKE